jgi:hypothetical protein
MVQQQTALWKMSEAIRLRDTLYLFACHVEWHRKRNLAAYTELLAALAIPTLIFALWQKRCCTEVLLDQYRAKELSKIGKPNMSFPRETELLSVTLCCSEVEDNCRLAEGPDWQGICSATWEVLDGIFHVELAFAIRRLRIRRLLSTLAEV